MPLSQSPAVSTIRLALSPRTRARLEQIRGISPEILDALLECGLERQLEALDQKRRIGDFREIAGTNDRNHGRFLPEAESPFSGVVVHAIRDVERIPVEIALSQPVLWLLDHLHDETGLCRSTFVETAIWTSRDSFQVPPPSDWKAITGHEIMRLPPESGLDVAQLARCLSSQRAIHPITAVGLASTPRAIPQGFVDCRLHGQGPYRPLGPFDLRLHHADFEELPSLVEAVCVESLREGSGAPRPQPCPGRAEPCTTSGRAEGCLPASHTIDTTF